jgi:predicted regulator of Ras-like GTPase activity (Roadblock/LC7/MglB family)
MANSEIEAMLERIMDQIPETEGLIAVDAQKGKKISGQTITEMNHDAIIKAVTTLFKSGSEVSTNVEKGEVNEIRINSKDGYITVVGSKKLILIGITGLDAVNSVSLISRNLHMILDKFG